MKDTSMKAVMVGPTVIQHDTREEAYDTAFRVISRKPQLTKRKIGIITDGEETLIKACENNFVGLRCTLHFKSNCKDYLKSMGVTSDAKQAPFLDIVFGETGLIEAEDKHDLIKKLKAA